MRRSSQYVPGLIVTSQHQLGLTIVIHCQVVPRLAPSLAPAQYRSDDHLLHPTQHIYVLIYFTCLFGYIGILPSITLDFLQFPSRPNYDLFIGPSRDCFVIFSGYSPSNVWRRCWSLSRLLMTDFNVTLCPGWWPNLASQSSCHISDASILPCLLPCVQTLN